MSFLSDLWTRVRSRTAAEAARVAAEALNARGNEASAAGRRDEAIHLYGQAIERDPTWSSPWFNLGLEHKRERRWRESLEANQRALALAPDDGPSAWNLGIAATALGDWAEARRAWRAYRIDVPDGEGPIEMALGQVPIRVSCDEAPEVVWCRRIDPARAVIESVPFPESGRRRGDLVLQDGAPNGYRMLRGREVPVFDELELLVAAAAGTWSIDVTLATPQDAEALVAALERRGLAAEDWTSQTQILCKACSEGRPYAPGQGHDHAEGEAPWKPDHVVGVSAERDGPVLDALAEWQAAGEGRSHTPPVLALPGGPSA